MEISLSSRMHSHALKGSVAEEIMLGDGGQSHFTPGPAQTLE
jgi:hypothetical protein